MNKPKTIAGRIFKLIFMTLVIIIAAIGLIMYYNTSDAKPISLHDILFVCVAMFIFDFLSKIEKLQIQVDELESRLEHLEKNDHDWDSANNWDK